MRASRKVAIAASSVLILCLMGSIFTLRRVDRLRNAATLEEVLYVSSPTALKRMSLGYNGLLADIYWTRAVQYFGGKHHDGATHLDLLAPLLDIAAALDPQLLAVYEFGSNFLAAKPPNGAGMPERAVKLEEFGIKNNPDEWRLYYNLGFIYYLDLKDYAHAAETFDRGSHVPNAHPRLKILAAQMAQHAGEIQTARMLWTTTLQSSQEHYIRANAVAHLRALQVDEDVTNLERVASFYKQKNGRWPSSFAEIARAGLMTGTPVDPLRRPYKLTADGHVEVRSPDDLPFIEKGTPPGYVPPKKPKFLPTD
jgi:tetratricopeptide (TPR) repeat protein